MWGHKGGNMQDGLGMKGKFELKLSAEDGRLKDCRDNVFNVITLSGKGIVAGLVLKDVAGSAFDSIAIGIGTAAATNTQVALDSEYAKTDCTGTRVQVTSTNDTAQLVGTFAFTGAAAVVEAGVFNVSATTTGVMLARQTFAALNATSGDTLAVTYKVTFA
jgi:hypothetical protein